MALHLPPGRVCKVVGAGDRRRGSGALGAASQVMGLTVRQPWASLIAAGIKAPDARSWSGADTLRPPCAIQLEDLTS